MSEPQRPELTNAHSELSHTTNRVGPDRRAVVDDVAFDDPVASEAGEGAPLDQFAVVDEGALAGDDHEGEVEVEWAFTETDLDDEDEQFNPDEDLSDYDIEEIAFLEAVAEDYTPKPVVAVVGRPNVGKSTLVNRIIGRREAVVQDTPGVTRDRVSYDADWSGRDFILVDTGGWASDAKGMAAQIAEQAEIAIELADAVMFVVDATVGTTDEDEAVVAVLRRSKKPVILVANKVDDQRGESEAATMWNLGLGMPWPVSAMHGRGTGDMLDALLEVLPTDPAGHLERRTGPRRVAIVGKPNVGKSSLLNKLAKATRAVVSDVSGTTVDPVDELVEIAGQTYRLIDTAGIRRRVKEASGHEYYASLRTQGAIERAEVCIVVIDASEEIAEQDLRILSRVEETGRALVIAYNKWDLTDEERRYYLKREIERDVYAFTWAPHVNISALSGRNVDKLAKAIEASLDGWETRIPTSKLNAFLGRVAAAHPHHVRGGKQPRILFGTQAQACPPTFVLFTSGQLDPQYVRFVERRLREDFGFLGTPVHVEVRAREKRSRR